MAPSRKAEFHRIGSASGQPHHWYPPTWHAAANRPNAIAARPGSGNASVDAVVRRTSLSVGSFDGLGSPSCGKLYDGHPCPSRLLTDWEVRRTVRADAAARRPERNTFTPPGG